MPFPLLPLVAFLSVVSLPLSGPVAAHRADTLDVLITGGQVYDGRSAGPRGVAVGLRGDRIVLVGDVPAGTVARRTINASGLIVAPGFIDPHTHAYEGMPRLSAARRQNASSLMQGITTVTFMPGRNYSAPSRRRSPRSNSRGISCLLKRSTPAWFRWLWS